jgi:hypothetical protein
VIKLCAAHSLYLATRIRYMAGCAEAVLFLVFGRWQLSLVAEVVNRGSAACLIGSLDQIRCVSTACMLHV